MAKVLRCRDLGLDCDEEVRGDSVDDILQKAYAHAMEKHQGLQVTSELVEQAKAAVKDE